MDQRPFTEEQIAALKQLMNESMNEYFASKTVLGKNIILTAAVVIGSVTVIFGGIKALLGWLGFMYVAK